jgi:iron complex transport system substrate-binding protein
VSPRRPFRLLALAAVAALSLSACATASDDNTAGVSADGAFPVTIAHAFGETEIPAEPERVVTWGWGSTEAALALGVVPVAIEAQPYAGDENGVLPWVLEDLESKGAETPTILTTGGEEPPYEEIGAADPDVILAPYSGITEEQFEILSAIAPTVVYPEAAWSTPWKDVISIVGQSLGRDAEAETVISDIDAELAAAAEAHPEFEGKTIANVWDVNPTFYVYTAEDPRVSFLTDLGFEIAPSVSELATGESPFYFTLSYEQLDQLESDILISYSDNQEAADTFAGQSYAQAIPAVANGGLVEVVGTQVVSSVSPPTALSLSWSLDAYVALLSEAALAVQ